jgi:heme oxygenase
MNLVDASVRRSSMRARLRAATDEVHQALHRAAPFAAIADGVATRESYGATLVFLYRYHGAMAGWCTAGAESLGLRELAAAHRARLAALRQDLAFLDCAVPRIEQEAAVSGAFAAGVLYTVQGSTLGGKVIHRQLDALLPDDGGRAFFKGSRDDGARWQTLCAALEQQSDGAALEAGARHGFARFAALLEPAIPVP